MLRSIARYMRLTRRSHRSNRLARPHLERLEDRSLMAVLIGGDVKVSEGIPYHLNLTTDQPVTQWSIDWDGNGTFEETISGNPSSVSHTYNSAFVATAARLSNIRAKVTIGGSDLSATVSALGQVDQAVISAGTVGAPEGNVPWMSIDPSSGELFVSSRGNTGSVRRFNSSGGFIQQYAGGGLSSPTDLVVRNGNLYVSDFDSSRVLWFDVASGAYLGDFVTAGSGGLRNARDLAFGPDGHLYVTSVNTRQILRFDGTSGAPMGAAYSCPTTDQWITSFTFRDDGAFFISEGSFSASSRVIQVDHATGTVVDELVPLGLGNLGDGNIAFGPDGDLYAANYNDNEVLHYDGTSGAFLGVLGQGIGDAYVRDLQFAPDGKLYASGIDAAGNFTRVNRYHGPSATTGAVSLPLTVLDSKTYSKTKIEKLPSPGSVTPLSSTISIPDSGSIYDVKVTLNATAPLNYLRARLVSPTGTTVELIPSGTLSGSRLVGTSLHDSAFSLVTSGTGNYTGDFRPWSGHLDALTGQQAMGTWTLKVSISGAPGGSKGTLDGWSLAIARDASTLRAESMGSRGDAPALTPGQLKSSLDEAAVRWQAAGADASLLENIQVQIADLAGTTLGLASGNTLWLDEDAAGWGWFVDATPSDDSEFTTPGNQGEQNRMDLLTVVMHELGHLLGHDHSGEGLMAESLAAGVRRTELDHDDVSLADQVFRQGNDHRADAWLGAWLSEQFDSMHRRGNRRR